MGFWSSSSNLFRLWIRKKTCQWQRKFLLEVPLNFRQKSQQRRETREALLGKFEGLELPLTKEVRRDASMAIPLEPLNPRWINGPACGDLLRQLRCMVRSGEEFATADCMQRQIGSTILLLANCYAFLPLRDIPLRMIGRFDTLEKELMKKTGKQYKNMSNIKKETDVSLIAGTPGVAMNRVFAVVFNNNESQNLQMRNMAAINILSKQRVSKFGQAYFHKYLLDLLCVRSDIAKSFGFASWRDYQIRRMTLETGDDVTRVLEDLQQEVSKRRSCILDDGEKEDCTPSSFPSSPSLGLSPMACLLSLIDLSSRLFGISFHLLSIPDDKLNHGWPLDIKIFEAFRISEDSQTAGETFMGHLYVDLGVYSRRCHQGDRSGASIVLSFRHVALSIKEPNEKAEIEGVDVDWMTTLAHELGHCVHYLYVMHELRPKNETTSNDDDYFSSSSSSSSSQQALGFQTPEISYRCVLAAMPREICETTAALFEMLALEPGLVISPYGPVPIPVRDESKEGYDEIARDIAFSITDDFIHSADFSPHKATPESLEKVIRDVYSIALGSSTAEEYYINDDDLLMLPESWNLSHCDLYSLLPTYMNG